MTPKLHSWLAPSQALTLVMSPRLGSQHKTIFTTWIHKALDVVLSKININNGFEVIEIWLFNPNVMDGKTKPNEFYTTDRKNNTLDEDNEKNSDETINDIEGWGEDGIIAKLINIAIFTYDITTIRIDVDGQEKLPRYYVEEPTSLNIIKDIGIKNTLDYTMNICEPTNAFEGELFHSSRTPAPIYFQNLLSLPHLLAK